MKNRITSVLAAASVMVASNIALAQDTAHAGSAGDWRALGALGVFLGLGLAALGGTLGQGKVASAAMDGIARNPQAQKAMFTPFILALALIESLVVLAFLAVIFVNGKLN